MGEDSKRIIPIISLSVTFNIRSMRALFLVFYGFQEYNGISKKIRYQVDALKECGLDVRTCYYEVCENGDRQWMVDNNVLANLGKGTLAKIKKRISFGPIINYIHKEEISFVYIRYYHNANPFTIHLVKSIKNFGAKVALEIPTYPYDQEFIDQKLNLCIDRLFRDALCRQLNAIVTFSNDTVIFGQRTIRISNGIDFSSIPLRTKIPRIEKEIHLIGVAEIHFWHGFDRVIDGLKEYYVKNPDIKVYFHIVGSFSGERERQEIEVSIQKYNLKPYVILHGTKHGKELDALFEKADFAVGSLARHRSGIYNLKTLKNREYAARGFGFIYSEIDDDFECMPYILKAPADETPIDIYRLIAFCKQQTNTPQEIRDSIRHLSWKEQMKIVCEDMLFHSQK